MQDHAEVARGLREIAGLLRFSGAPWFKAQAYENAALVTQTVGEELGLAVEQGRLRDLEGIGAGLSRQIEELWNTGTSALLERLRAEQPPGAAELMQVSGMTPERIVALSRGLGIRSIADLREACMQQRVRGVKGFGPKTEQSLLAAAERAVAEAERSDPEPLLLARALTLAEAFAEKLSAKLFRRCLPLWRAPRAPSS